MSTLRQRCARWLESHVIDTWPDVDADTLQAFVLAEIMRKQTPTFDDGKPLVLMFKDDADRHEFVEAWKALHPVARTIKVDP